MNFERMKNALVRAAQSMGLEQYEIYAQTGESVSVETLKDEVSSFVFGTEGGICFRCIVDGKMGYASGELMTEEAMEDLVRAAISNARCIDNEDEVFIFKGSPAYETVDLAPAVLADAAQVRATALELQKATYAASDKVGDGTQSVALSFTAEEHLYNSHGLSLSNRVGLRGAYVAPVVRDGDEAQNHTEFALGMGFESLSDLPQKAVCGALDKLGAVTVPSGKYDVIFDGKQFRGFLSAFSGVFSAKNAQQGLSLLAGKEGSAVAASCVTLTDDPMRKGSPMQTPFDGEGVATARRCVIENGTLKTLLYDLTTAAKAGVASTGNGQKGSYAAPVSIAPYNFSVAPGTLTEEELFAQTPDGIYITECKGFHAGANEVTGDFSIESAGFRIRNGKRAEPIKSFTVAGNFFDLLKAIDLIANDVKWGIPRGYTVFGSPSLRVRNMSIAGD
ncbi:MAG: TldD/PmbA family protein [Ruminococcaceae bacterium]|nr:TldD/PmbA family protein [Oscillospiraceae bacterium]